MAKLCQIIAVQKGVKASTHSTLSELYKLVQKPDLFNGFTKSYQRRDDTSEELPPEDKRVQFTHANIAGRVEEALRDLFRATARLEYSNCTARSAIDVDGVSIATDVPVTYLLFLEKQLTDLRTFVSQVPVLDPNEDWHIDAGSGLAKSNPVNTHRTRKIQKPLVLYPATAEHPAQTQLITEDVIAGYWSTIKMSGALPAPEKAKLEERVEKLLRAVKEAREGANSIEEVPTPPIAGQLLTYIFG
ncbi:MAG TPA: hypothetical protein VI542_24600 [Candidatus Tectomicrobia bacterium]